MLADQKDGVDSIWPRVNSNEQKMYIMLERAILLDCAILIQASVLDI